MQVQDKSIIQSIEKIPSILDLFKYQEALTLHEIHIQTDFSKTSTLRMCNSLVNIGFLEKVIIGQTPYYRLGIKLYRLGIKAIESIDIRSHSKKYLLNISKSLQDNAYLFVNRENKALCVDKVEGDYHILTNGTKIGDVMSYHIGGGPQAMFAHFDKQRQENILEEYDLTEDDISKITEKSLENKSKGFSFSKEEFAPGTAAIGAPIFDASKNVVGALSVGGIVDRFSENRLDYVVKVLCENASKLSQDLGFMDEL